MHVEESNKSSKTKNQHKTFKAYKMVHLLNQPTNLSTGTRNKEQPMPIN